MQEVLIILTLDFATVIKPEGYRYNGSKLKICKFMCGILEDVEANWNVPENSFKDSSSSGFLLLIFWSNEYKNGVLDCGYFQGLSSEISNM